MFVSANSNKVGVVPNCVDSTIYPKSQIITGLLVGRCRVLKIPKYSLKYDQVSIVYFYDHEQQLGLLHNTEEIIKLKRSNFIIFNGQTIPNDGEQSADIIKIIQVYI